MPSDNEIKLILSARDEHLKSTLARSETHIKAFSDRSAAALGRLRAHMKTTGEHIKAFGSSYMGGLAAIGVGFGVAEMAKDVMEFEGVLRKMKRTGGLTTQEIGALRAEILSLIDPAAKVKMPLNKGEWAESAKALHDTGIEWKTILAILPNVGKGAVASHTEPKLYAEAVGELLDKYKVAVNDLPALQEQLNVALKLPDVRKDPEAFLRMLTSLSKPMQIIGARGCVRHAPRSPVRAADADNRIVG
jgi:hypothetical protein